jgi:hypothetical protein
MSYCRWSTDDFQCDLYVYEDCDGGYTTHVAGNRPIYQSPLPEPVDLDDTMAWLQRHDRVMQMLTEAKREDITLPHAGERLHDDTAAELLRRLQQLKQIGYRFPDYVLELVAEEAAEDAAKT